MKVISGIIHEYSVNGLYLRTGDIICTTDGGANMIGGQFWRLIGKLIPGEVDHVAVYIGPDGRCVESGARGKVITFNILHHTWDTRGMYPRRKIIDELVGVAYPLFGRGFSEEEEIDIRQGIGIYCLEQARLGKPYNLNFLNSETDEAFYCSQLVYKAYQNHGVILKSNKKIDKVPGSKKIIFPQEIWENCNHSRG